jgi:hypothetical protein
MRRIAGDHEDRPYDSMADIDPIGKPDLSPMQNGHNPKS